MVDNIKISSSDARGTAELSVVSEGIDINMYSSGKSKNLSQK